MRAESVWIRLSAFPFGEEAVLIANVRERQYAAHFAVSFAVSRARCPRESWQSKPLRHWGQWEITIFARTGPVSEACGVVAIGVFRQHVISFATTQITQEKCSTQTLRVCWPIVSTTAVIKIWPSVRIESAYRCPSMSALEYTRTAPAAPYYRYYGRSSSIWRR